MLSPLKLITPTNTTQIGEILGEIRIGHVDEVWVIEPVYSWYLYWSLEF